MAAYLRSKNLWGYALGNIQKPFIPPPPASADVIAAAVAACNQWAAKIGQVMGTIVLKCAPSVLVHLKKENSGEGYWNALKAAYQPKLMVNRKQVLEPVVWKPTMQELALAAQAIAETHKNEAPTSEGQQLLANQILLTLLSNQEPASSIKPAASNAKSEKHGSRGGQQNCENKAQNQATLARKADQFTKPQKGKRAHQTVHQNNASDVQLPHCKQKLN